MPVVTAATLVSRVRDYADQPDDGQPGSAYVTDTMIYNRLSKEIRRAYRVYARAGVYMGRTSASLAAAAEVTLGSAAMCILSVHHDTGSSRMKLARLVDTEEPLYTSSAAVPMYWRPNISTAGAFTIDLYPTPTSGTIKVSYVPEPAAVDAATTVYLTDAMEDMVVLGAACRCYAREDGSNAYLMQMYEKALEEVELDAAQYSAGDGAVIRNSDNVYTPGEDQTMSILDPADVWNAP